MTRGGRFSHRPATMADLAELRALMAMAIRQLVGAYLDAARVEASFEIMGVDTQLIEDGTYFAIESEGRIVGCGGWSRRATLFGGDHSGNRDERLLDPAVEPARVRAMYTHPDFARRGVGRLVLALCEAAAAREGFRSLDLVATVAGEPLYSACGFSVIERIEVPTSKGVTIPCARMRKEIGEAQGRWAARPPNPPLRRTSALAYPRSHAAERGGCPGEPPMDRGRYQMEIERLIQDRIAALRGLTFDQAGALPEAVDEEVLVEGRKCALTTFRQRLRADEILVTVQLARRTLLASVHTEKGLVFSHDGSVRDASREELLASGG